MTQAQDCKMDKFLVWTGICQAILPGYSTRTKTLRGKWERTVVIRISVWGKSI